MNVCMSTGQKISDAEFEKFRDFFYRKTGIFFDNSKRYFVDKRIVERMKATDCRSFREYFVSLRFEASGDELQKLINLMTVNETYFFREKYQLECLVGPVLAEITRHKSTDSRVRIWSIPSSTGEEPYSIALYLLEYWPGINEVDVEIIASDIDTHALERCQEGIYSDSSLRHVPAAIRKKYFEELPRGRCRIAEDLRQAIQFTRTNLNDAAETTKFRGLDVIFCRNLLIYFDDVSRRQAAETFFDALSPGGFIFLGHSESMSRLSALFEVRKFSDAIVYQKPA